MASRARRGRCAGAEHQRRDHQDLDGDHRKRQDRGAVGLAELPPPGSPHGGPPSARPRRWWRTASRYISASQSGSLRSASQSRSNSRKAASVARMNNKGAPARAVARAGVWVTAGPWWQVRHGEAGTLARGARRVDRRASRESERLPLQQHHRQFQAVRPSRPTSGSRPTSATAPLRRPVIAIGATGCRAKSTEQIIYAGDDLVLAPNSPLRTRVIAHGRDPDERLGPPSALPAPPTVST